MRRPALILLLFAAARIPLLVFRAPFFDELFTHWIAGKSLVEILAALRHDSGPPLYYFVVHLIGDPAVMGTRVLSLLCAAISIILILRSGRWDPAASPAVMAALVLAVFPAAVLFAADARAYAMCAMFVTMGVLAIDEGRPVLAAITLVAGAYCHYYGVLFFPLLLLTAAGPAAVQPAGRRRYGAVALALVLYLPGFWLAFHQPAEARAWMAARWPDSLFVRPPLALAIIGAVVFIVSLRFNRYMVMVLVPLILAVALRVYVPLRFEAVVAAPLVLWLAESLRRNRFQVMLMTALVAVLGIWSALGIIDHARRPPDPYRQAALWIAGNIPSNET
ncbi:MAG: hypothetical protein ACRD3J_22170, partial [Thermoanaerobaculia bacterium]